MFFLNGTVYAQSLFLDEMTSNPTDEEENVLREKGRKGILCQFKYFLADGVTESNEFFPLDMSMATVILKIGTNPSISCSPGINPIPNASSYRVVDGEDSDGFDDTVEIFYNGTFTANTSIQVTVSGARATDDTAQSTETFTFKTGDNIPRDPASIELVFDISGSMGWKIKPGGTMKRMDALHQAVGDLFPILNEYAMLGDKIGLVYFSTSASVFDPTPGSTNLEPAHDLIKVNLLKNNILDQVPTNNTSIGAGLQAANLSGFGADPSPNVPKNILLFSDGEQNTSPLVNISGGNIQIGGATYPGNIKISTVTAGWNTAPGWALQDNIADYSLGSHLHVRYDEEFFTQADLGSFFSQAISDILVGDKLELVKDVTSKISKGNIVNEKFFANLNDLALSILLSWSSVERPMIEDVLHFRLKAPNSAIINLDHRTKFGNNMAFATIYFPLRQNGSVIPPKGEWEIELLGNEIESQELNYHLVVILDNKTIETDFEIATQDVSTGEKIPLRVKLTDDGAPVLGATVVANISGPSMGLGDILSLVPMPGGEPDPGGDKLRSPAQAKLLLLLRKLGIEDLFKDKLFPPLTLVDNGQAINGDAVANDGIYSAIFHSTFEEGHYHFTINAHGASVVNGDFQRTKRLSVFVRPKAAAAKSDWWKLSSVTQPDGSLIVRLSVIPKDTLGNFLGPDYLDHLNVHSSEGTVDSPLEDKLDGSYEISYRIPSSASNPWITFEVMGVTVRENYLSKIPEFKKWILGVHGGYPAPIDTFGNEYEGSFSVAADLEFRWTHRLSLGLCLGHDRFSAKIPNGNFHLTHLSGMGKIITFQTDNFRALIHGGVGAYFTKDGNIFFGLNGGGSIQYWFGSTFGIELGYNFRTVDGGNLKYSTFLCGLRFGLK